ncbi:MAG: tRNA1(Val) (adenine(37)-N6)-methyltransferase [Deltaproteobacteria bacterium]|nr:tRNA1(Val) (adenine(37)-N6)-methyltransferase [Deltaproteobacteria bacterium]
MDIKGIELHSLFEGRLSLYQYRKGYRFSIDTLLLGAFARTRLRGNVADLGTGSGVLPVLLARSPDIGSLTGFEIQPELADLARRNVDLHDLGQRVRIEQADIKEIRCRRPAESFDGAIANPPFYPLGTGRINPGSQDAAARHEILATLSDFVSAASFLIKNGGRFCAIFPASRSTDLICTMRENRIEPKVLRCVHSCEGESAVMLLVEGIKNAGSRTAILPPLIIYSEGQSYSPEVQAVFNGL